MFTCCEKEAIKGDAAALGLSTQITKPTFIETLLLLSQVRLVSLLGYFDHRNATKASLASMLETGDLLPIDGHKLWLEFSAYQSLVERLPKATITSAMQAMYCPDNKETMNVAYPVISDILARISTLPASSAEVERVFSTMKRIKTLLRNGLGIATWDNLIRVSMIGPPLEEWDATYALRIWEASGNQKLTHK